MIPFLLKENKVKIPNARRNTFKNYEGDYNIRQFTPMHDLEFFEAYIANLI